MPGWLLRVGAQFHSTIPEEEVRAKTVSGLHWGRFEPARFTYLTRAETAQRINSGMLKRKVR